VVVAWHCMVLHHVVGWVGNVHGAGCGRVSGWWDGVRRGDVM
jgi:hypothetical protein